MAPGSWNGHSFGGLHTGTGKYQKGGVYSSNGLRYHKNPNYKFKENTLVKYIGSHKDYKHKSGVVISKVGDKQKSSRSIIKVQLENMSVYFHKNNLDFV